MLVTEDMKKMVQIPILRPRAAKNTRVFGVSLSELQDRGLVEDGVPVMLRSLVEHLRKHGEKSLCSENVRIEIYLFNKSGN